MARWFAECHDVCAAHVLWRNAFGLYAARHFHLQEDDAELTTPRTSWWDAPPVLVPTRIRAKNTRAEWGHCSVAPDYTSEKQRIAQRQRREHEQLQAAMRRFVGKGEVSLHDIGSSDAAEFDCLLALLDEALAGLPAGDGTRRAASSDGRLLITLRASRAGSEERVTLKTPHGLLRCANYRLTMEPRGADANVVRVGS